MLTRRYALYIMAAGLALLLAGAVAMGFHAILGLLIAFNGLVVAGGGVWVWMLGRDAV